jgi:putative molybdopterin biosynthesis protein
MPSQVNGYERELDTHLAVASSISKGEADTGLGIEAAARSCNLDFIPLFRERYDLVIPKEHYSSILLAPLLELVTNNDFKRVVDQAGGYDTEQTGMTTFL